MGLLDWLRGKKPEASTAPTSTETSADTSLQKGLEKTRRSFWDRLKNLFTGRKALDAETRESLEETLLLADVGPKATENILLELERSLQREPLRENEGLLERLERILVARLERPFVPKEGKPYVILLVGVNGVGKTTSLAKLAARFAREGQKVVIGAADTFRAAAISQLRHWAEKFHIPLVEKGMGADPGAVAYETIQKALQMEADVVLIDTAGRLHTKEPLMRELSKVYRVIGKALPGAPHEVLLVLDATTGQNALRQAQVFLEATACTGIILTKLDGTAKGGVAFALVEETGLPIRFIGVGEGPEDLLPFEAPKFVKALLRG
jgi:fused signal recognition particle receptor